MFDYDSTKLERGEPIIMSDIAEGKIAQVGGVGEMPPIANLNIPAYSNDEYKKTSDESLNGVIFQVKKSVSERYFKNGDSFSHVRGLIDKMRGAIGKKK